MTADRPPWPPWRLCLALTLLLLAAAWGARAASDFALRQPVPATPTEPLAEGVPHEFGRWRLVVDDVAQIGTTLPSGPLDPRTPYTEQVVRSYGDGRGHVAMLTLSYVAQQTPYTRPHPPEGCYAASGFDVQSVQDVRLAALEAGGVATPLMGRRMLAQRGTRREAVVYWIRVGDLYTPQSLASRWHLTMAGLHGERPDGMLVRASLLLDPADPPDAAYAVLEGFLADLLAASPTATRDKMRRTR